MTPVIEKAPTSPQVADPRPDQAAEVRIERLLSIFVGAGCLGYLPLLAGSIVSTAEHTAAWWTPTAVLLTFGPSAVLLTAALTRHRIAMHWAARACAVGPVVATASFGLAWDGHPVPQFLWFFIVPEMATVAAAISMSTGWMLTTLIAGAVPANGYQYLAREASYTDNLPATMLFCISFTLLFASAAIVAMRTGRILDATRANTYAEAAAAAGAGARRSQRSHIDALLHDWVISTMLAAGRQANTAAVRRQAAITLDKLDSGPIALSRLPAATAMAQLRAGVLDVDLTTAISTHIDSDAPDIPTDVIDIIDDAVSDAVRNSILHAGPGARTTVSLSITGDGVRTTVTDHGTGFSPDDVPPHRLGVAVSVLGRVRTLPGGSAEVITAPGEGTRVDLRWTGSAYGSPGVRRDDTVSTRKPPEPPATAFLSGDVRDLLGMNTRTAHLVVAFFLIALTAELLVSVDHGSALLPGLASLIMVALCAAGLLKIPADPLPAWSVVVTLVCVPIVVYLSFIGTPLPLTRAEHTWQFGAFTAVAGYMCVRGRIGSAWLFLSLLVAAAMLWTHRYGDSAAQGLSIGANNFGLLFAATLFALTVRPAAADIYQSRKRAVERNAARVASLAAVAEHDKQMRALNHRVRPMLERIADPAPLTDDERAECLALEAQLRDALRAPILAGHERTAQAAARARGRGVTVVMVDGHGLDDTTAADREYVLERLACALDTVTGGSIIIRVLPPGRDLVATAVIDPDAGGTESASYATRLEFALP